MNASFKVLKFLIINNAAPADLADRLLSIYDSKCVLIN